MGEIRERLIKKRDEVFEAHRLSDEARLTLSEHQIEPAEEAQKRFQPTNSKGEREWQRYL
jgi:hypothetical protein